MSRAIRATRISLFGLAVAAALGFGASTALADVDRRPCPLITIGSCGNLSRCQSMCAAAGGDVANARCDNGCCYCPRAFL